MLSAKRIQMNRESKDNIVNYLFIYFNRTIEQVILLIIIFFTFLYLKSKDYLYYPILFSVNQRLKNIFRFRKDN